MSTAVDVAAMVPSAFGVGGEKRLLNLLDVDGQERVAVMKTRYELLLPLERSAFLQELGLVATRDLDKEREQQMHKGKRNCYNSNRLSEVRTRDVGYVLLNQETDTAADGCTAALSGSDGDATGYRRPTSDATFQRMIRPSLFGEGKVPLTAERESMYERIHQDDNEMKAAGEAAADRQVSAPGKKGEYMYRSNAYQALRLAHSFPGRINLHPSKSTDATKEETTKSVTFNMTGIPLYEDDLRVWFDEFDKEKCGELDLEDFNTFMRSLDRDFGVESEYNVLAKEGERLARGGKLSFEAFAYLVLRFARV